MADIQLPELPASHSDFLRHLDCHKETHPRSLLQPYLAYEDRLREVFAQQPQHPALDDNLVNVVPIYDGAQDCMRVHAREESKETNDQQSKYMMPLKSIDRKPQDSPAVVSSLQEFQSNFSIFSEASLSELDWRNVVAAGSSVVTSLLPVPSEFAESKRTKREWYHEKVARASDVDLFLYGLTEEQAVEKIKQIERCIRDSVLQDTTTVRTKNAITIASVYPTRHVQIVLRIYKSISEVLTGFDVDCACVAYDGKQVYASPRAIVSFMTQTNEIDLSRRSPSYENRLQKYAKRGFEVHWEDLDRERIDPTIYERSFGRTVGLARLLIYEKLPEHTDREAYTDERRVERGRPAANNFLRHAHELPGNFKQHAVEEVNEAIHDDAVASYHTFSIPYGPKYSAKRIEKLLYTKDLLLNAEWNKPKDREVNLHRHPAFFGSVDDVIKDCCGLCPAPVTEDEREVAEEEAKIFVTGNITFLKDDPGRQAIGSFNPINDDEWTKMAYVGDTARLCSAITHDDLEFVEKWCQVDGNDVNERDYCGRTPLHLAVTVSTPRIVQCLIDNGARLIARLVDGKTSLHLAAIRGGSVGLEIVRFLLRKSEANEEEEATRQEMKRKTKSKAGREDDDNNDDNTSETDHVTEESFEDMEIRSDDKSPAETTTAGSFVKIEGGELTQNDFDMSEDERTDGPDIYDVNLYSWDIQITALHYAVIFGHRPIVRELVQSFGADILMPVKLVDSWNSRPRSAILTPVLTLHISPPDAQKMLELLLQLGVTSSQADMDRHSALHRFVAACKPQLVQTLLHEDGPTAKKAINFFIPDMSYGYMSNGVTAPLISAIKMFDQVSLKALIHAGAKTSITFNDCEADEGYNRRYNRLNKDTFNEKIDQPVITAAKYENADAVRMLLAQGADVNTLSVGAHKLINFQNEGEQRHNRQGHMVGETLLDITQTRIQQLEAWNPLKCFSDASIDIVEPTPVPPDETVFAGTPADTFKHNRLQAQLRRGKEQFENERESYERKLNSQKEQPGLALKKEAIRRAVNEFVGLKELLVSEHAKSFNELYPLHIEANEERQNDNKKYNNRRYTSYGGHKLEAWRFRPELGFLTDKDLDEETTAGCEQMFEDAWNGDLAAVKSRSLKPWGRDRTQPPIDVSMQSTDFFIPFTLSAIRGHLGCAEGILEICAAQYQDPNDPEGKKKYNINASAIGEDDDDDDELEVESEDEDGPFTTDIAADVSKQVKGTTSPETALDWTTPIGRIRDIAPTGLPDTEEWSPDHGITVLQYAIATGNELLVDWVLDLKLKYRRLRVAEADLFDQPVVGLTDFKLAMRLDQIDILNKLVKRTGAGLALSSLVQDSGVQVAEKPRFYPGLTVYGSKRKAWAQRGRQFSSNTTQSSAPPLLYAAWSGSLKAMRWAMGTGPERLYSDFAKSNESSKHIQALSRAEGGFAGQLRSWLRTRGNLVLLLSVLTRDHGDSPQDNVDAIRYLASTFKSLLETRSPIRGYTPLMLAFAFCDADAVRVLLKAGADQTCRDNEGNNLLHVLTSGLPNDNHDMNIPDELKREMLDLIDPRLLSSMFLERSASVNDQSFLTPLARFLKTCSAWYQGENRRLSHNFNHFDARQIDKPENYPDEGMQRRMKSHLEVLQLFLENSPENKDLDALDGSGDTVAHLTARCCMFPLFRKIIEHRPLMLFRENAVGRTPFEIARDGWLEEHIKEQPQIPSGGPVDQWGDLSDVSFSVATQKPEYFVALQRYEDRMRKGKQLNPELTTFVDRIWQFAVEVAAREEHKTMPRRLVSLNEANIVAERLARRERKTRDQPMSRRARMRARRQGEDEASEEKIMDEVEHWSALHEPV